MYMLVSMYNETPVLPNGMGLSKEKNIVGRVAHVRTHARTHAHTHTHTHTHTQTDKHTQAHTNIPIPVCIYFLKDMWGRSCVFIF